jgi:predicted phage-related endonuclease
MTTWEQARTGKDNDGWKLGGSSAGIVLGLSPFCDRFTLWARMRDGVLEPDEQELDEDEISEVQEAGNIIEDAILAWYGKRTGRLVIPPAFVADWMLNPGQKLSPHASPLYKHAREIATHLQPYSRVYYGPDDNGHVVFRSIVNPLYTGTFDAFVFDESRGYAVIDAKNVKLRKKSSWDNEGVPPHYKAQNHHYMLLHPYEWTGWATLFGGQHLGVYDMDKDHAFIELIVREEHVFAGYLDRKTPPPKSVTGLSLDTLKQLFPTVEKGLSVNWQDDEAVYTDDGMPIMPDIFDRDWLHVTLSLREYHKRKAHLEATLRYLMGEAEEIALPSGVTFQRKKFKRQGKDYTKITRYAAPKDETAEEQVPQNNALADQKLLELEAAADGLFGE